MHSTVRSLTCGFGPQNRWPGPNQRESGAAECTRRCRRSGDSRRVWSAHRNTKANSMRGHVTAAGYDDELQAERAYVEGLYAQLDAERARVTGEYKAAL